REIIAEAGKSTRFMAPPTEGFRLLRDATLALSLRHDFVRPLYHWRTSRANAYRQSPHNSVQDDNAIMPAANENGSVFANLKLADGSHLYDHFGEGFQVVYMAGGHGPQAAPESLKIGRASEREGGSRR